jgi:hypothetical protein
VTRKTIRLVVTMPDPGPLCDDCHVFRVTEDGEHVCNHGFRIDHSSIPHARPQSCRDAEVPQ